jgi:hypothetical protein
LPVLSALVSNCTTNSLITLHWRLIKKEELYLALTALRIKMRKMQKQALWKKHNNNNNTSGQEYDAMETKID